VTDYTPWINTSTDAGGWFEKRFTFSYRAPISINKAGRIGEEERYCYGHGRCTTTGGRAGASPEDFTNWSSCSKECGGGKQFKIQICSKDSSCMGSTILEQACNTQACIGKWGCWGEWSPCSVNGKKMRTRNCDSRSCTSGSSIEEIFCDGITDCTSKVSKNDDYSQSNQCSDSVEVGTVKSIPVNMIVGACVCGFIVGASMGAILVYYYFKYKKLDANRSPHYISAKSQNLYVSLPMLDLKHKQLSSNHSDCSGTLRSNVTGTLRSKTGSSGFGGKHQEYETATIKRSHSRRDSSLVGGGQAGIRADLESDQMFT